MQQLFIRNFLCKMKRTILANDDDALCSNSPPFTHVQYIELYKNVMALFGWRTVCFCFWKLFRENDKQKVGTTSGCCELCEALIRRCRLKMYWNESLHYFLVLCCPYLVFCWKLLIWHPRWRNYGSSRSKLF